MKQKQVSCECCGWTGEDVVKVSTEDHNSGETFVCHTCAQAIHIMENGGMTVGSMAPIQLVSLIRCAVSQSVSVVVAEAVKNINGTNAEYLANFLSILQPGMSKQMSFDFSVGKKPSDPN